MRVHGKLGVHKLVLLVVHGGVAAGGEDGEFDDKTVRGRWKDD